MTPEDEWLSRCTPEAQERYRETIQEAKARAERSIRANLDHMPLDSAALYLDACCAWLKAYPYPEDVSISPDEVAARYREVTGREADLVAVFAHCLRTWPSGFYPESQRAHIEAMARRSALWETRMAHDLAAMAAANADEIWADAPAIVRRYLDHDLAYADLARAAERYREVTGREADLAGATARYNEAVGIKPPRRRWRWPWSRR